MFEAMRGLYVCSTRRRKGPSVCSQELVFGVEEIDHIFLDKIEGAVFQSAFIDRLLDEAFAIAPDVQRDQLLEEQSRLTTEITNITKAIATGADISALVDALKERDSRLKVIAAQLAKPVVTPDRDELRAALEQRIDHWREVLRGPHIAQARTVLQHVVELPLKILNEPIPTYIKESMKRRNQGKWTTNVRMEGFLVGLMIHNVASPAGFEPAFWP